jgi:hypothetical protein
MTSDFAQFRILARLIYRSYKNSLYFTFQNFLIYSDVANTVINLIHINITT